MNIFEKLVDIIITVCILILCPMSYMTQKNSLYEFQTIYDETSAFVQDVTAFGYITQERYELLLNQVYCASSCYQIQMEYEEQIYEPVYELEGQTLEPFFSGVITSYSFVTSMEQMIASIQQRGIFMMEKGGYLRVTITFPDSKQQPIYCGGQVR